MSEHRHAYRTRDPLGLRRCTCRDWLILDDDEPGVWRCAEWIIDSHKQADLLASLLADIDSRNGMEVVSVVVGEICLN